MERQPTRPALLMSPAAAMPCTMVKNTSGATPALISDRNMSPSSLSCFENVGNSKPTAMPSTSDSKTCMPSLRYHGVFLNVVVIMSPRCGSGCDQRRQLNCLVHHLRRQTQIIFRIGQALDGGAIEVFGHGRHCGQRIGQ